MTTPPVKAVIALWRTADLPGPAVLGPLRESLRGCGVTRLQLNVVDAAVESALRLQHFPAPVAAVVSVWTSGDPRAALEAVRVVDAGAQGWLVEERVPLAPPAVPDGVRADALANLAFLRRPEELAYDAWLAHWWGPHTQIAMETQATFGYVQNRVVAGLTDDVPPLDAIVEELFPAAATGDIHAFYGSGGDDVELGRRIARLMESVAAFGADRDLDLVPTGRYVWDLA